MEEDYQIEKLKNSKKMACDAWTYSIQRMDLLIISISGAGVYVILETLKYSREHPLTDTLWLKIAGVFLVLSIIINFLSQRTGQITNDHHIKHIDEQLSSGNVPTLEQKQRIDLYDSNADKWHSWTEIFNWASMTLMAIGLVLLCTFFLSL